jgi:hypothetical protein
MPPGSQIGEKSVCPVAAQVKPPHHADGAWPNACRRLFRLLFAANYQGYQVPRIGRATSGDR